MTESTDRYEPSRGLAFAIAGVALFAIGGLFLANANEADFFVPLGLISLGSAFYLLVAGAVARGIQAAGR